MSFQIKIEEKCEKNISIVLLFMGLYVAIENSTIRTTGLE